MRSRFDTVIGQVRAIKEQGVADGHGNLPASLYLWRGDGPAPLAIVAAHIEHGHEMHEIINTAIPGFMADAVVLAAEAVYTTSSHNPLTGQAWRDDDFEPGAIGDNPALIECFTFYACDRSGRWSMRELPFVRSGQVITWLPEEDDELVGDLHDLHRAALEAFRLTGPRDRLAAKLAHKSDDPGQRIPLERMIDAGVAAGLIRRSYMVHYDPGDFDTDTFEEMVRYLMARMDGIPPSGASLLRDESFWAAADDAAADRGAFVDELPPPG